MTARTIAEHQADRPTVTARDGVDCGPYTPDQLVELYRGHMRGASHVTVDRGIRSGRYAVQPEFTAHYPDGRRMWITFPGGMAHSGYYRCDTHPNRPAVRFDPAPVQRAGRPALVNRCADC